MINHIKDCERTSAYSGMNFSSLGPSGFGMDNQENPAQGWSPVIDELFRIRTLGDDWDGEGTEAPHPSLVDGAITLAQTLRDKGVTPPGRIHASVNATVYFEWYTSLGYTEIEVVSPVEAKCRLVTVPEDKRHEYGIVLNEDIHSLQYLI